MNNSSDKKILSGCIIIKDGGILLLFRKDHKWYETLGGKVNKKDSKNPAKPSVVELENAAKRELLEEVGKDIIIEYIEYFGYVEFQLPDGRIKQAHKFITSITGNPKVNEPDTFSKLEYLPIKNLEKYPISSDLKLFLGKIQEYALKK